MPTNLIFLAQAEYAKHVADTVAAGESKPPPNPFFPNGSVGLLYNLTGVVVHSGGSARSGHYYSFVRGRLTRTQWYELNDSSRSPADFAIDVAPSQAYLLFFQPSIRFLGYIRAIAANAPMPPLPGPPALVQSTRQSSAAAAPAAVTSVPGVFYGPELPPHLSASSSVSRGVTQASAATLSAVLARQAMPPCQGPPSPTVLPESTGQDSLRPATVFPSWKPADGGSAMHARRPCAPLPQVFVSAAAVTAHAMGATTCTAAVQYAEPLSSLQNDCLSTGIERSSGSGLLNASGDDATALCYQNAGAGRGPMLTSVSNSSRHAMEDYSTSLVSQSTSRATLDVATGRSAGSKRGRESASSNTVPDLVESIEGLVGMPPAPSAVDRGSCGLAATGHEIAAPPRMLLSCVSENPLTPLPTATAAFQRIEPVLATAAAPTVHKSPTPTDIRKPAPMPSKSTISTSNNRSVAHMLQHLLSTQYRAGTGTIAQRTVEVAHDDSVTLPTGIPETLTGPPTCAPSSSDELREVGTSFDEVEHSTTHASKDDSTMRRDPLPVPSATSAQAVVRVASVSRRPLVAYGSDDGSEE